ncbi:hypothetical protein SDJN03_27609, partial [Cucurbita argyrosperma subsp. sororia]
MSSTSHRYDSSLVHSDMISTPLKLAGRQLIQCSNTHKFQFYGKLLSTGFVQTNSRIAIRVAFLQLPPTMAANSTLVYWFGRFRSMGTGGWNLGRVCWPGTSKRFCSLTLIQFGGEVVNSRVSGFHMAKEMGSGHLAGERFRKASYFRNLKVVKWDNTFKGFGRSSKLL